jgi:hypothetical protein
VNHAIAASHTRHKGVHVSDVAHMPLKGNHIDAMGLARLANQAPNLVALGMQLTHHPAANEPIPSCNKNLHVASIDRGRS